MGKVWEKKEYESKQIASTFWWDSALFQIILSIIYSVVVAVGLSRILPLIVISIISAVVGVLIALLSEKIAIKKVRERAIVKKLQVNEIVKKFAIKYVILILVAVLVEYFSQSLDVSNVIIWIAEAIFGTFFAKKLLTDLAID